MPKSRKPGRPPLRVEPSSDASVLRLLQEAYLMEGSPGATRLAESAGVRPATALAWLRNREAPDHFVTLDRLFAAMGYELRLSKARSSVVEPFVPPAAPGASDT